MTISAIRACYAIWEQTLCSAAAIKINSCSAHCLGNEDSDKKHSARLSVEIVGLVLFGTVLLLRIILFCSEFYYLFHLHLQNKYQFNVPLHLVENAGTMEALLEAARIAEITCTPANTADSQLTEQMASMQCQLQRLVSCFDRCSTSPVAADRRSVSPRPKVTFGRNMSIPTGPYEDNPTAGPARTSTLRGQFRTGRRPTFGGLGRSRTQPPVRFQTCSCCGYEQHTAGATCPAVNRACNYCRKHGHFSRVCRAVMQNRQE